MFDDILGPRPKDIELSERDLEPVPMPEDDIIEDLWDSQCNEEEEICEDCDCNDGCKGC